MPSPRTRIFEGADAERARLAAAPVGSVPQRCANLPVTLPVPAQGMLVELIDLDPPGPQTGEQRVVVLIGEKHTGRTLTPQRVWLRNATWRCTVVSSTHPGHHVGGRGLIVDEARLRRSAPIG